MMMLFDIPKLYISHLALLYAVQHVILDPVLMSLSSTAVNS
jgi:hypothetical protein